MLTRGIGGSYGHSFFVIWKVKHALLAGIISGIGILV
jgi:hypothetical protein